MFQFKKLFILIFLAGITGNFGIIAQNTQDLLKQAEIYRQKGDITSELEVLNKAAFKLWEDEKLDDAADALQRIIEISIKLNNRNGQLIALSNLGAVYHDDEKYSLSFDSYLKAIELCKQLSRKQDLTNNLTNAANALQGLKKYDESNKYIEEALVLAKELNNLKLLRTCYRILAENHEKLGETNKTMEYWDLFNTYDRKIKQDQMNQVKEESAEKVNKAEAAKLAKEIELKHTVDTLNEVKELTAMQRMEIDLLNKQKQIDDLKKQELERKLEYRRKIVQITSGGLFVFLLLFAVIFFQFIQKRKANKLLAEQNEKINRQNKQITDSISYAQTIQRAILPVEGWLKQYFDAFIIFRPKDMVSGDFYWFTKIDHSERWIIAVVDCTGHGVPGAFISILGISYLSLVISKYKPSAPSQILNHLREYFMKSLDQTGKEDEQKDGIDMSLCIFNKKDNTIQFAGAFNPVYIVRDNEIIQIEGDKMPIGVSAEFENSFVDKDFALKKHDMLYLFTDGFPDQFGGEDGKKYKYRKFRELLIKCSTLSISKQKNVIIDEFVAWKGNQPQIDDMTIFGIKI